MSPKEILFNSFKKLKVPKLAVLLAILFFVVVAYFPVDNEFYSTPREPDSGKFEYFTEHYMRYSNTILGFAVPLLARDPVGLVQVTMVTGSSVATTYSLKKLLNNQTTIDGSRRLGERPRKEKNSFNMPSGHSNMASIGLFFVARRYGFKSLAMKLTIAFMVFVLIATMYTRVMLDAHTITATIAGATVGLISALLFSSPKKEKR